jgi:hypothetical protein
VTGQVIFGDLLDVAREHLDQAGRVPGRPGEGMDLLDVASGTHALVVVIGRYLQDGTGGYGYVLRQNGGSPSPWPTACARARRAAASAARHLQPPLISGRAGTAVVTERGRHLARSSGLAAAAQALAAGRDLLATHVAQGRNGVQAGQSPWVPVVRSPAFSRALAAEMGTLARQVAALSAGLVMMTPAGWAEPSQSQRDLTAACQYLRMLAGAVRAAQEQEPVLAGDRELLRAIPVGVAPERRLPDGSETVAELCKGVTTAAERLRHSATLAARRSGWSPQMSSESLRHAAAAGVATSHHCSVLLGTLATRFHAVDSLEAWELPGIPVATTEASAAAGRARDGWLRVARTLDLLTSDMPAHGELEGADARDLALWTGRLAYADPNWTLPSGPRSAERTAADLVPAPQDASAVVAAVHHASDSLRWLAEAHKRQARAAARAERFLVPTRSLPDYYDIPRPYGPAPPDQVTVVLAAYKYAHEASSQADARVAEVADATRSPSAVLTLARDVRSRSAASQGARGTGRRDRMHAETASYESPVVPGPVERSLQLLGVTNPDRVRHAILIDRAGEQLIIDASTERQCRPTPSADPGRSVKGLIYDEAMSSSGAMTPLADRVARPHREQRERQAE